MNRLTALGLLLLVAAAARADFVAPGFSRVPNDKVIEIDRDYSEYRFWLVSTRGVEPLPLAVGKPYLVDGSDRGGDRRIAHVVAATPGVVELMVETMGAEKTCKELTWKQPPAGVMRSDTLDFYGAVPFYDTRERVVDRYRLEVNPPDGLRLMWLGQNAGSPVAKAAWAVAGLFACAGIGCAGWLVARRLWRAGRVESATSPGGSRP